MSLSSTSREALNNSRYTQAPIEVTPANTHDITVASKLIRSDDKVVYGDSGFVGIEKRPEVKEDEHLARVA